jgi:hypothetical protein
MQKNTPTPQGMYHREGQTVEDIANAPQGERVLKVSQNTQTNKVRFRKHHIMILDWISIRSVYYDLFNL